ncbi:MAG: DUF6524 family protein [Pseudomonadota bacterium]
MIGFLIRWLVAFVLLALTFNPTQWNFVNWARLNYTDQLPVIVLAGLLLFIGYVIYLRATLRSIGLFGMLLVLGVVAALAWVAIDYGWLTLDDPKLTLWLGLGAASFVLGVGLSWSHARRFISGQSDVDDVDE